jgi:hypothetical protein
MSKETAVRIAKARCVQSRRAGFRLRGNSSQGGATAQREGGRPQRLKDDGAEKLSRFRHPDLATVPS